MATHLESDQSKPSDISLDTKFEIEDLKNCSYDEYVFWHPCHIGQVFRQSDESPSRNPPIDATAGQIRLLRIAHPSKQDEALRCTIHTAELNMGPPFFALSYMWGSLVDPKHTIWINGEPCEVSQNLFNFLCTFRNDPFNTHDIYLWIDQICIDQMNFAERNSSVLLMPRIYRQAIHVIQWLGSDPGMMEAAAEFQTTKSISSLTTLLDNRYFTRLWIIQEVLLAKRVKVLCGSQWLDFREMAERAQEQEKVADLRSDTDVRQTSRLLLRDGTFKRQGRSLNHCLRRYSANHCVDARDKVYGLLGLVREDEQVPVDYNRSVLMVFLDTLKVLARIDFRLQVFNQKPVRYVALARTLAQNMGLVLQSIDILDDADGNPLLLFLDELRDKEPDDEWFQKVVQRLGP